MSQYVCSNCGVDFDYQQGLSVHLELGCEWGPDEDNSGGESLSLHDAADIWMSNGMDDDYTFGFDAADLRRAADES
jgi:hypothetical protein